MTCHSNLAFCLGSYNFSFILKKFTIMLFFIKGSRIFYMKIFHNSILKLNRTNVIESHTFHIVFTENFNGEINEKKRNKSLVSFDFIDNYILNTSRLVTKNFLYYHCLKY